MRLRLISALCVVLPLIYSPRPAAAQTNLSVPQPPQSSFQKLPLPAKLSEFQIRAESVESGLQSDLSKESANLARSLRSLLSQREGASALRMQSYVEGSPCAHILMFPAPDVDSKMIIEMPKELISDMPMLEGVQACSADFRRQVVSIVVIPPEGSGRFGRRIPAAGMQSDGRSFRFLPETPLRVREKPVLPAVNPSQSRPDEGPRR